MADRYVALARPRRVRLDYGDDFGGPQRSMMVFEDDAGPVETGLYDANGVPLYRVPERVKMGFRSE